LGEIVATLKEIKAELVSGRPPEMPEDFPIRFGKYKGRNFSEMTPKELNGFEFGFTKMVREKPSDNPRFAEENERMLTAIPQWMAYRRKVPLVGGTQPVPSAHQVAKANGYTPDPDAGGASYEEDDGGLPF
jgi:hypothetical protein